MLNRLVQAGVDNDIKKDALMWVIRRNEPQMVRALLAVGAPIPVMVAEDQNGQYQWVRNIRDEIAESRLQTRSESRR